MLHYIGIKQVDIPVHNCDTGVPLLCKAPCFGPIPQQFSMVDLGMPYWAASSDKRVLISH
jgi:hypothetical protein